MSSNTPVQLVEYNPPRSGHFGKNNEGLRIENAINTFRRYPGLRNAHYEEAENPTSTKSDPWFSTAEPVGVISSEYNFLRRAQAMHEVVKGPDKIINMSRTEKADAENAAENAVRRRFPASARYLIMPANNPLTSTYFDNLPLSHLVYTLKFDPEFIKTPFLYRLNCIIDHRSYKDLPDNEKMYYVRQLPELSEYPDYIIARLVEGMKTIKIRDPTTDMDGALRRRLREADIPFEGGGRIRRKRTRRRAVRRKTNRAKKN